jgi:hypothetical protein
MAYKHRLSLTVTKKMLRASARICVDHTDDYRPKGLGLTGFVRTAIQNEIDRQNKKENALRDYFMQEVA